MLAALAVVVLATGCTRAGVDTAPPTLPEVSESTSDSDLASRLLSETDLPAGYTETELPNLKGGVGSMVGCPALDARPGAVEGEATVAFAGGVAGSLISETVRLSSTAELSQAMADLKALPQRCLNAKSADFAAMGTESTSVQLTATPDGLGITLDGYLVGVRNDQVFVLVVYVSPDEADPAIAEAVAKTAWEKAAR